MGEGTLEYRDLVAWQQISGITLQPWEAAILKRLSRAYLAMSHKALEPNCPMPYTGVIDDIVANRDTVDHQIRMAFSNLKKAPS